MSELKTYQLAPARSPFHDKNIQPLTTFLALPPEIHYQIASQLPYPDLLALTLAHPRFRNHPLVRTSKSSRVDWLIDRAMQRLPLPSQSQCRWSSDEEFLSNSEVVTILYRRRHHLECAEMSPRGKGDGDCFVVKGRGCPHLAQAAENLQKEKWEGLFRLFKLEAFRKSSTKARQAGLRTVRSWQGAVVAILLAAVLWLIV